ncbi:MAG TPA: alpha/beta hydrolase [Terriglobales bacterium]|nr:alpha/beta hydrolase [Terriglobales bacterium]
MNYSPKRLTLNSGITLEYVEQGDQRGTPIVFLHGITDSWHSFEPVFPFLPADVRAIALSLRGHGDSSRPDQGYTPSHMAADVNAALAALGISRTVVVGHSMGSYVSQRLAIEHPGRVSGLVLIGTAPTFRGNSAVQSFWDEVVRDLDDPIDPAIAREFQESTVARPLSPAFLETVVRESLKVPARVWREAFAGLMEAEHTAELAKVNIPCLLLWGDHDNFFSHEHQQAMLAAVPGCRLIAYEGLGHAPHWDDPKRVADDVVKFVGDLRRSDSSQVRSAA